MTHTLSNKPFSYKQECIYYASLEYACCKYEICPTSLKVPWFQYVEIEKIVQNASQFFKAPTIDSIVTC